MSHKTCGRCGIAQEIIFFSKSKETKDGHSYRCKTCDKEYTLASRERNLERSRKWYAENKDRRLAVGKTWIENNKEKRQSKSKEYRDKNRESINGKIKEWAIKNKDKVAQKVRKWQENNRGKCRAARINYGKKYPEKERALAALYQARKIQAMPRWASKDEILKFYKMSAALSKSTGIRHHVDHIVPLRSKYVCGLHCEFNLQILTDTENCKKSNKFTPGAEVILIGKTIWQL